MPEQETTPKTVLLAGATGLTGGFLAAELARRGGQRVVALVRKPASALPAAVEQRVVALERLAELEPIPGVEAVYCAIGSTIGKAGSREAFRQVDYDLPLELARFGLRCGARQYLLVSSVAADPGSPNFYLRVKGELEAALAALGYPSLHIFRPSMLLGPRAERRPAEAVGVAVARAVGWALAGPLRKYRGVEAEVLARAMIRAAERAEPGTHVYHFDEITRF